MYFELPLPVISKDLIIYTACELRKPTGGTLADVKKVMATQSVAHGMIEFMKGVIVRAENSSTDQGVARGECVTEKVKLEHLCRRMPVKTAEAIVIKAMAMINTTDYVRGIYDCPGCGNQIKVSKDNNNSIKYIDLIIDQSKNEPFEYSFTSPIIIEGESGDIKAQVSSMTFNPVTMNNYITGITRYPNKDIVRQEYSMFIDSIIAVDGKEPDIKWLRQWGMMIFERMDYDDLKVIYDFAEKGGIQKTIEIYCPECGETFQGDIDPRNFFVSGLRRHR